MIRAPLVLWLVVILHSACFRLSDPIYAGKPLRATEPLGPEYSLVFVTIQHEGGLFATDIDTIYFRRIDPPARGHVFWATDEFLFRVFERRSVKDGNFLIHLTPGVYELPLLPVHRRAAAIATAAPGRAPGRDRASGRARSALVVGQ